jgi:adenine-specific DNA-methyltransferase
MLGALTSTSGGESTQFPFFFQAREHRPAAGGGKSNAEGFNRLQLAARLGQKGDRTRFARNFHDFEVTPVSGVREDTVLGGFIGDNKIYVVQTTPNVIERCILMTTDPGDLVLDPTCGSGTTADVAEQWGSRVALALAKHRLMTAKFDYQQLRPLSAEDVARIPHGTWLCGKDEGGRMKDERKMTFKCKTVPHITLKSIARNTSLAPIFARHEPILMERLSALNQALDSCEKEWRAAWRAKMDEVNACISANAEMEELVDKPETVKGGVRVSGPFTMEGVIAVEDGPDTPIGGAPGELDTFDGDAAVQNSEAHLDKVLRLLKASGVDFPRNKNMKFSRLDPLTAAARIHADVAMGDLLKTQPDPKSDGGEFR